MALCTLCIGLLVCCTTPAALPRYYPDQSGRRDASSEKFLRQLRYPYQASKAKRRQIERATRELHVDMSEVQVLTLLGPPDIKEDVDGYPPKIPPYQTWTYVHTFKYRAKPGYYGKILVLYFPKNGPRTITEIEPFGFQKLGNEQ